VTASGGPSAPAPMKPTPLELVWDMETGDPDDFLTLLLLLDHPAVALRGVTITPGTPDQVGLVRLALGWFGRDDLPVGAHDLDHPKACVSAWHRETFGDWAPSRDAVPGGELLHALCGPTTTLLGGAAPKNLGAALARDGFRLGRWVQQGGFAGEGVVPPERQLAKFRGLRSCPTFNLNGAPKAALAALASPAIGERRFVSKNVCHGVAYDQALHDAFGAARSRRASIARVWEAMDGYLRRHPGGKLFHDPLAAACAIDPEVGRWAEVRLLREKGGWGAELAAATSTWIIVDHDPDRFVRTLLA
jgi:hypothetical protein